MSYTITLVNGKRKCGIGRSASSIEKAIQLGKEKLQEENKGKKGWKYTNIEIHEWTTEESKNIFTLVAKI